MPKVYSYMRFSTPEQAMGDSERRQLDAAKAWAERNNHTLDELLTDHGVSAKEGKNAREGQLGEFLKRVNSGIIEKGSILLVENIDRISRQRFRDSFKLIQDIVESGIVVQTLNPEVTYNDDNLDGNDLFQLLGQMQRAHEESKLKSQRLAESWKNKRKSGKFATSMVPAWCKVESVKREGGRVKDGKIVLINEAAETIKHIFRRWMNDGIWPGRIARELNGDRNSWKPPELRKRESEGWRQSYIKKLLGDRRLIGEMQFRRKTKKGKYTNDGDPVKNYFPSVFVTKDEVDLFNQVQLKLERNKPGPDDNRGQTGKFRNIFRTLIKCGYCGGSMVIEQKGPGPKGGEYLVCDNAIREVRDKERKLRCANRNTTNYEEVQRLVLHNLKDLKPEDFFPEAKEQQEELQKLRRQRDSLIQTLKRNAKEQADMRANLKKIRSDDIINDIESDLIGLKRKHERNESELNQIRNQIHSLECGPREFEQNQKALEKLENLLNEGDVEIRMKANSILQSMIEKIEVFGKGSEKPWERDEGTYLSSVGSQIRSEFPELSESDYFQEFLNFAGGKTWDKEARFYYVWLRTPDFLEEKSRDGKSIWKYSARARKLARSFKIAPNGNGRELRYVDSTGKFTLNKPLIDSLIMEFFDGRYLRDGVAQKKLIPKSRFKIP